MKVAFITYGVLPVPATKGGAVENLIEDLLDENEKKHSFDFSVLGVYEEKAAEISKKYRNSIFYFVKCPSLMNHLDKCIYWGAKNVLKRSNLISYRFILRRLYVMSKFPKILLENNFDRIVLVTNSTLFFVLKNQRVFNKYKEKVIYYLHNEVRSLFKCEKEASSIRSLIGISEFVNNSFRKQVQSLRSEQCFILQNGVDTERFSVRDEKKIRKYRNRFGIAKDDFVVIFVGRLVVEKGALETIKVIKACNDKSIKLLIVGASFYSSDVIDNYTLKLQKEAENIKDRIVFTGYIDYENMPSIYQLGNVAVLPSMWDEPAGMTMVEAVVSGLPVVTTNSGGISEYIPADLAFILKRDDKLVENICDCILQIKAGQDKHVCDTNKRKEFAKKVSLQEYFNSFEDILNEGQVIC